GKPPRSGGGRKAAFFWRPADGATEELESAPLPGSDGEARHGIRYWPGGYWEDLPRRGHGDLRPAGETGESHHPCPPRGGSWGTLGFLARHLAGKNRSLSASLV